MEMARKKRDPKKAALAKAILEAYQPETAEDMNNALKDLFGPMFEAMLKGEYSGVAEPCFPLKEPPNIPVKRANLSANESQ